MSIGLRIMEPTLPPGLHRPEVASVPCISSYLRAMLPRRDIFGIAIYLTLRGSLPFRVFVTAVSLQFSSSFRVEDTVPPGISLPSQKSARVCFSCSFVWPIICSAPALCSFLVTPSYPSSCCVVPPEPAARRCSCLRYAPLLPPAPQLLPPQKSRNGHVETRRKNKQRYLLC